MKSRAHHLAEERLFDCYLTVRGGEMLDPPVAEHLIDCEACGQRYADLTQFMQWLDTEATAETEDIFTPDRLGLQRAQIARKLEHLGHAARVITFPGRPAGHRMIGSAPRSVRRWIAAAAAAGLFVGVGTGLLFDWDRVPGRRVTSVARQTVLMSPAGGAREAAIGAIEIVRPDPSEDNVFLSTIELAGQRPHISELDAVDALTPHVREITLR